MTRIITVFLIGVALCAQIGVNPSGGGGTTVNVNGSSVSTPNLNATTPAAEANYLNAKFQVSGSSVSAEVPTGTTAGTLALGNHTHNMALEGAEYDLGTCTTAMTVNSANGRNQKVLLTAGDACALTLTLPASGIAKITLRVIQAATPTGSLSWPACVLNTSGSCWPGGIVPIMTASANAEDEYTCKLYTTHARCTPGHDFK